MRQLDRRVRPRRVFRRFPGARMRLPRRRFLRWSLLCAQMLAAAMFPCLISMRPRDASSAALSREGSDASAAALSQDAPISSGKASADVRAKLSDPLALQRCWKAAIADLKRQRAAYGALLLSARASVSPDGAKLLIEFSQENTFAFSAAQKPDFAQAASSALQAAFGGFVPFEVIQAASAFAPRAAGGRGFGQGGQAPASSAPTSFGGAPCMKTTIGFRIRTQMLPRTQTTRFPTTTRTRFRMVNRRYRKRASRWPNRLLLHIAHHGMLQTRSIRPKKHLRKSQPLRHFLRLSVRPNRWMPPLRFHLARMVVSFWA